jgi:hypothetical protein
MALLIMPLAAVISHGETVFDRTQPEKAHEGQQRWRVAV